MASNTEASREAPRTGISIEALKQGLLDNLFFVQGRFPDVATPNDYYQALAYTIRDRLLKNWIETAATYKEQQSRTICYLSAEYLPGPHLGNNLLNLGLMQPVREALNKMNLNLDDLLSQEEEPGLGNGGLGRLAACFMDSLATLQIPSIGYGIRYEFGIFNQTIRNGWQQEITDKWLHFGNPWEILRPEIAFDVPMGGHTEHYRDKQGRYRARWIPNQVVRGIACDTAISGYGVKSASLLRLWKAEAAQSFDFQAFNVGDYYGAVTQKVDSETISKVLYPNDEPISGKRLRLMQQFFFVTCSLQDMIRLYFQGKKNLHQFHEKFAVQLNDTHPSIAIAELMRLLVDEHDMDWEPAWEIVRKTFAYTNHTLLPEALEKWPLPLFQSILPRHLEIIYEINRHFLDEARARYPGDEARIARLSLIDESGPRFVRMAHLAGVGSHAINGVARLHSDLLKKDVMRDFYELWPEKFYNVTNGVTPRRFLALSNPRLAALISDALGGDEWLCDLPQLRHLETLADHKDFQEKWRQVKHQAKVDLARAIAERTGVHLNPKALFDIHVKRIHEYKRQHLNILHIIHLYQQLKQNPEMDVTPRAFIFAGKAAPGYWMAKLIIKLINSVADIINNDPDMAGRLQVVFVPNFNVKSAQWVYPGADLSEQISTAGLEASGTGNMKFAINGALTIGTLDGANVEIQEEVGAENFFLFGLTVEDVAQARKDGYRPHLVCENNPALRQVLEAIGAGAFSQGDRKLFTPLLDSLWNYDPYFVLKDFQSYAECQAKVSAAYRDIALWTRMSILNVARIGKFSSDRAIMEYCKTIWNIRAVKMK